VGAYPHFRQRSAGKQGLAVESRRLRSDCKIAQNDSPMRSITLAIQSGKLSLQLREKERGLGSAEIRSKGGDSFRSSDFGSGMATVDGKPESDDPGSVQVVGKISIGYGHNVSPIP